jgi:hypothetical protein
MIEVLVYGAGAIGSFVGYLLSEMADAQRADTREIKRKVTEGSAVRNVALLGRKGHIQRIKESGLRINTPEESRSIRFNPDQAAGRGKTGSIRWNVDTSQFEFAAAPGYDAMGLAMGRGSQDDLTDFRKLKI